MRLSSSRTKTIENLTKTLGLIFAISLVSLVHKLDSFDLERDIDSLRILERVNAPVNLKNVFEDGAVYEKALEWLVRNRKSLGNQNASALREMQGRLVEAGLNRMDVFRLKSPGRVGTKFSLIRLPTHEPDSIAHTRNRREDIHQLTVVELMRGFRFFSEPREIVAVTELDPGKIDTIIVNESSDPSNFRLRRIYLAEDEAVAFLGISDNIFANAAPGDYMDIRIKTRTESTDGPSFYTLLNGGNLDVEKLARNESQLTRLGEVYGRLQYSLAKSLASEDFSRAYRSITIFGLTFSTRRFAFAIMIFCLATMLAIAWVVHQSVAAEMVKEQIQLPLRNLYARSLIWIVLPQAAIVSALPPFGLSIGENGLLYGGAFATGVVGVIATLWARRLWPREQESFPLK